MEFSNNWLIEFTQDKKEIEHRPVRKIDEDSILEKLRSDKNVSHILIIKGKVENELSTS